MNLSPIAVLYTQDDDLARRAKVFLRTTAEVRLVSDLARLDPVLQQVGSAMLIIDLRARESLNQLERIAKEWPDVLVTALGTPRSEPMREAEEMGLYAVEDLQLDRAHFQALAGRAFDHLHVLQENKALRETNTLAPFPEPLPPMETLPDRAAPSALPFLRFPRIFRRFDNVEALLENIVEGVADATAVTRVGIFSRIRKGDRYRLRAGLRCLPESHDLEFGERDQLVRWFEMHAHLIARSQLARTSDASERAMLRRTLDTFGAEVIVPLYARGRIIGWLFLGHRITGQPFSQVDLESLMILAEHTSTVLENALLYEEVSVQKTLAETLLKSIPPGIIATDEDGIVRWFNPTAEQILGVTAAEVLNRPVETAGSRLASIMRETLDQKHHPPAQQWIDGTTHRSLSVETRKLTDQRTSLGAVAVVQDMTVEENLRQKQDLLDRTVFWNDLAASMSHEIRNPLVAIKTFAQLLPERFDDADFRHDFNSIVVEEIERLDRIITQINDFAHPAPLQFMPIDLRGPLNRAIDQVKSRVNFNGTSIETSLPNDLPTVLGDENALTEALAQLITNATEATAQSHNGHVTLTARTIENGPGANGVVITVQDNGRGISVDLQEKIFSPFCTTKARGMGLGLPIVKRTVFDHNGRVDVESNGQGTVVSVMLPATLSHN